VTQQTLLGARRLREVFAKHGFTPKRSLGQNFVIDPNTVRKIVEVSGVSTGDRALEIGAGAGSLTLGLAGAAGSVVAVEVDSRLQAVVAETLAELDHVEVVWGDALQLPLGGFGATVLVANLPYNVATPVVLRVLEDAPEIRHMTVMTQREAGERLAAAPGSKVYGQVSAIVAYFGDARVVSPVSRRAFYPVPNVDSVLVRIDRAPRPSLPDREWLFTVIRSAFSQRRKTLRNALAPLAGVDGAAAAIADAGIPPTARAEELGLDAFAALSSSLDARSRRDV
jgi:16S rRNA (adenine1518-N6/adenine1519-N6)-dimethyltransferase